MIELPVKNPVLKVKGSFIVRNDRGLHTRPSTEIVRCMSMYKSQVILRHHQDVADAKSILGVLMLAAPCGAKMQVEAIGEDAEEAMEALLHLAQQQFNMDY